MQLNEVIEENSIATISKRTRISVENIEKLVQRDFSDMKRVKALGFISILEREFGIELDSLKKECGEYFASSPEEEFDARLVVTVPESGDEPGGWFSKLLILLVLFGIGYGAWYFLADKETGSENNATIRSTSFVGSIVNQAKAWLGESSTLDADKVATPAEGVWAKDDAEENGTDSMQNTEAEKDAPRKKTADEQNDSVAEEQIIREVKQEQKEILAQAAEPNTDDMAAIDKLGEVTQSDTNTDTIAADEMLATEVPSMANEQPVEAVTSMEKILPPQIKEKPKAEATAKAKKNPAKKAGAIQVVTLHPAKKVWVGYTDLSTMKRAAKVIEEDIDFDTSAGSWILVAGHNAINFVIKGKTITPTKRDKNYFLIEKGKVKEISKEEFQKRNKSTVW